MQAQEDDDLLEPLGKSRQRRGHEPLPQVLNPQQVDDITWMLQARGARDDGDELK